MKTAIFNLIILDESGSMCPVRNQTIAGCNETINTIRAAQKKYADTQEHFVSIFAFQSEGAKPSRYLVKNVPVAEVRHISGRLYDPDGCTPLYDAIGSTLADLKAVAKEKELAVGSVTIITDGCENSSVHYSLERVARTISALKELGWSFNFIGANIDVESTAARLCIDNAMEFRRDAAGTAAMFAKESRSRMGWLGRTNIAMEKLIRKRLHPDANLSPEEFEIFMSEMRDASADYFNDEREGEVDK